MNGWWHGISAIRGLVLGAVMAMLAAPQAPGQATRALVADGGGNLYEVNLLTGDRSFVSGTRWARPAELVVEPGGTALVLDCQTPRLDRVDPVSGTATTVADHTGDPAAAGGLTLLSSAECAAIDGTSRIVVIDLSTGAAHIASAPGIGDGPPRRLIRAVTALDASHVVVAHWTAQRDPSEPWPDGLYTVDLGTGDWALRALADPYSDEAEFVNYSDPREILLGDDGSALLLETITPELTTVDASGDFLANVPMILPEDGEPLVLPVAAAPSDDESLLVLDHDLNAVYRVGLLKGTRTLISRAGERGSGPPLDCPNDMALASGGDAVWVLTGPTSRRIIEVDLVSGDRRVLFDPVVGDGPLPASGPIDFRVLRSGDAVALLDGGRTLMRFSPSGSREVILGGLARPLLEIAAGPGQTLWGACLEDIVQINLDTREISAVASLSSLEATDRIIQGMWQISPHRLLLALPYSLREIDPLAPTPSPAILFRDPFDYHAIENPVALDADRLIFLDYGRDRYSRPVIRPAVYHFTRGTEEPIEVATRSDGLGDPLPTPRQLAIDEAWNIFVANSLAPPGLYRIEPDSRARTQVSGPTRGAGPLWQSCAAVGLLDGQPDPARLDALLDHLIGRAVLAGEAYAEVDADDSGTLDAADLVLLLGP